MSLRELLNEKPWIGWVAAAMLGAVGAAMVVRGMTGGSPQERLSETVTIKCVETGEEWEMNRGMMERELIQRSLRGELQPGDGIINPSTGRPTGYPFDKSMWEQTVDRIRQDVADARASANSP